MLKIGEFSHLSQVPIKTLRYYDEINLFKPAEVDAFTNHRFYTLPQLPEIHRIMALKELGLTLDQIRLFLQDNLDEAEIRGILRFKEAELQQEMREAHRRLERVQFHLKMIEMETTMKTAELAVVVKELEPMHVMTLKWHPDLSPTAYEEVKAAIKSGKIQSTGKFMQISTEETLNDDWSNAKWALEVQEDQPDEEVHLPTQGTFRREIIPGASHAATIVIHGVNEEGPSIVQGRLNRWAVENGYQLCNETRFIGHRGPIHTPNKEEWIMEIQAIVEPRQ